MGRNNKLSREKKERTRLDEWRCVSSKHQPPGQYTPQPCRCYFRFEPQRLQSEGERKGKKKARAKDGKPPRLSFSLSLRIAAELSFHALSTDRITLCALWLSLSPEKTTATACRRC